jgi:hypothetical protein
MRDSVTVAGVPLPTIFVGVMVKTVGDKMAFGMPEITQVD